MPTRLAASGRSCRPSSSDGRASGSVLALRIFLAMVSASSVMVMRDISDGSDLLILFWPLRKDITRVAGPWMSGSGCGKNKPSSIPVAIIASLKSTLNFWAMSRESSRCCFWSSPTGTWVA